MLILDPKQFELIRPLTWPEVFEMWRANEESQPHWIEHYTSRGFSSWEEWRKLYADAFKCPSREWHLYKITNPLVSIPTFHGGPFKTWIERHYGGKPNPTFAELAERQDMQAHAGLKELLDHFPGETTISGLIQNGEVTIIEGMHRCVAVALAARTQRQLPTTIFIAMADAAGEVLPAVGQFSQKKA